MCVCVRNGLINSCPFRVLFVSLMVDLCRMPITQVSLGNILTILLRQRVHDKRKFRLFVFSFANIDRHFKCDAVHSQNIRTANKLSPKQKKRKEKLCVKSNQSSFCSDNFFSFCDAVVALIWYLAHHFSSPGVKYLHKSLH